MYTIEGGTVAELEAYLVVAPAGNKISLNTADEYTKTKKGFWKSDAGKITSLQLANLMDLDGFEPFELGMYRVFLTSDPTEYNSVWDTLCIGFDSYDSYSTLREQFIKYVVDNILCGGGANEITSVDVFVNDILPTRVVSAMDSVLAGLGISNRHFVCYQR